MDSDLLLRIDADPEVRNKGRSAFIRSAVKLYLAAKQRQTTEVQLAEAYSGQADDLLEEIQDLIDRQPWPGWVMAGQEGLLIFAMESS